VDTLLTQSLISQYSNKEVSFRYNGRDLSFYLSQALFSSYEIDKGSKFLLKTISRQIDFDKINHVLDIGCGIGTLGVSLQKGHPHIQTTLQDRDALAVAFSRWNADKNSVGKVKTTGGLALQGLERNYYDLIVSNIPAKAGEPVLKYLYRSMLHKGGIVAMVVVNPLADFTRRVLKDEGAEIRFHETGPGHTVFHCALKGPSPQAAEAEDLPSAYFREKSVHEYKGVPYSLDTVWGLADFDTPPFQTLVAMACLKSIGPLKHVSLWNPGQGHTAALLAALPAAQNAGAPLTLDLFGRDMLGLQATRHNLLGYQHITLARFCHSPSPLHGVRENGCCSKSPRKAPGDSTPEDSTPELFIVEMEHLAGLPSPEDIKNAAAMLLKPGGYLLITGKSGHLHHFNRSPEGFCSVRAKKHKGFKAVMLKRG